jgi:peptidoglycan/xylan/chitin deacetylase (PgdA/CDA1 family)
LQYISLSHDVDWRRQGPPLEHIIARKERFSQAVIEEAHVKNPYYNIPEYMELEEKHNIRSTFFFRTLYENGDYRDYENDIKSLDRHGWEIGLHCDPSSINEVTKMRMEKEKLEQFIKHPVYGNRSHYLAFSEKLPIILKELGFVYDSSYKKSKDKIENDEIGFSTINGIIEFPVTIMDAYLFTYMHIGEDKIVDLFRHTLNRARNQNSEFNVITVIWHDNVLKMRGGRTYGSILDYLSTQDDVKVCRAIDIANTITNLNKNQEKNIKKV